MGTQKIISNHLLTYNLKIAKNILMMQIKWIMMIS